MATAGTLGVLETQRLWRWRDLLGITALSIMVFLGGVIALVGGIMATGGTVSPPEALLESLPFTLGSMAVSAVALIGAVFAGLRWRRLRGIDLGLGRTSWRWLLAAAGAAILVRLLAVPLTLLLQWLGLSTASSQLTFMAPEGFSWGAMLGTLVLGGIVVPFAEELFFRGVLYNWLRRWGIALATGVSALVFAAIHGELAVAAIVFWLGIATAIVYERSRSLWAAVVVHVVFNVLGIGVLYAALAAGIELPGM
ncbi:MAG: hypothetical protein AVDCRST_MAG26-1615 [uncultured Chloroflexia bacterium]|uniref:CAAX prenyl protease 2/Lysostaphin resistance protein A-like domain-containing protein n=1 Tax=uncultured Chloroflexia bacterium TaxID=1672391 RepID=A0A6J4I828_9CHLR|nr:MAG: hypothetical protein AVDCRST_MAG26-1615 [uncultured Chloroflexia bacterium]